MRLAALCIRRVVTVTVQQSRAVLTDSKLELQRQSSHTVIAGLALAETGGFACPGLATQHLHHVHAPSRAA